jgi:hypothetical protein
MAGEGGGAGHWEVGDGVSEPGNWGLSVHSLVTSLATREWFRGVLVGAGVEQGGTLTTAGWLYNVDP